MTPSSVRRVAVGVSCVVLLAGTWALLTSRNDAPAMTCRKGRAEATGTADSGRPGMACTGDGCPWQYVLSDLTNRLQLLEAAFKEQVTFYHRQAHATTTTFVATKNVVCCCCCDGRVFV